MLQLFFVFVSFCSSFLMLEHSFSSSKRRSLFRVQLMSTITFGEARISTGVLWVPMIVKNKEPARYWCTESKLFKKQDLTITRRVNISFCAAWVLASKESFWQFISLQSCSRQNLQATDVPVVFIDVLHQNYQIWNSTKGNCRNSTWLWGMNSSTTFVRVSCSN